VRDAWLLNQRVHAAVANRLVPGRPSLLRQAGRRLGGGPSAEEATLFDSFFRTRRVAVCGQGFSLQLSRRLAMVISDLGCSGLYYDSSPVSVGIRGRYGDGSRVWSPVPRRCWPTRPGRSGTIWEVVVDRTRGNAKDVVLTQELRDYLVAHGCPPDPVARGLIAGTEALGGPAEMQIPPEQGAFLTMLARLLGARRIVEVGTFTGYSTLCLARGLSVGGRVVTCDISREWTAIAREAWSRANVDHLIDLRVGPALETLATLPREPFVDLAFIDADKVNYVNYWEQLVPRMRLGGLLVVDNVFYYGEVVAAHPSENGAAIRKFNDHASADPLVELVMLPVADGVTLARRLEER